MEMFNIVAGICSISGFLLCIFINNEVKNIKIKIIGDVKKTNQQIDGNNNTQSGGNINV